MTKEELRKLLESMTQELKLVESVKQENIKLVESMKQENIKFELEKSRLEQENMEEKSRVEQIQQENIKLEKQLIRSDLSISELSTLNSEALYRNNLSAEQRLLLDQSLEEVTATTAISSPNSPERYSGSMGDEEVGIEVGNETGNIMYDLFRQVDKKEKQEKDLLIPSKEYKELKKQEKEDIERERAEERKLTLPERLRLDKYQYPSKDWKPKYENLDISRQQPEDSTNLKAINNLEKTAYYQNTGHTVQAHAEYLKKEGEKYRYGVNSRRPYYEASEIPQCIISEREAYELHKRDPQTLFGTYAGLETLTEIMNPTVNIKWGTIIPYHRAFWSYEYDSRKPVYTRSMSQNMLTSRKIMWNDQNYSMYLASKSNKNKYISDHTNILSLIWDKNITYRKTQEKLSDNKYMAHGKKLAKELERRGVIELQNKDKMQIELQNKNESINLKKLENVALTPLTGYFAMAYTIGYGELSPGELREYGYGELSHGELIEYGKGALISEDKDKDIEKKAKYRYFNGILTESEYVLKGTFTDRMNELAKTRLGEIMQRIFLVVANEKYKFETKMEPYFTIYMWYVEDSVGKNRSQKRVPIFSGTRLDFANKIKKRDFFLLSLTEYILTIATANSDEAAETMRGMMLDPTRFVIQEISLIRSGGGCSAKYATFMTGPHTNHDGEVCRYLDWGNFKYYDTKNNNCFFKVLHIVRSKEMINTKSGVMNRNKYEKTPSCISLRKVLAPGTGGKLVDMQDAREYAKRVGQRLVLYNVDGDIIEENVVDQNLETLRVLLHANHYSIITTLKNKVIMEKTTVVEPSEVEKKKYTQVKVYYDLETVYCADSGAESNLKPYSISWKFEDDPKVYFFITDIPSLNVFFKMFEMMKNRPSKQHYTMIAYNGSGFDHAFLFTYLDQAKYVVSGLEGDISNSGPAPTGKIYNMDFIIATCFNTCSMLRVWDPYLFALTSLNNAARDFGIDMQKNAFDHNEVQEAYSKGYDRLEKDGLPYDKNTSYFKQYIDFNKEKIQEYNDKDVIILEQVTNKIIASIQEITGYSEYAILHAPTLSNLSYKLLISKSKHVVANPLKLLTKFEYNVQNKNKTISNIIDISKIQNGNSIVDPDKLKKLEDKLKTIALPPKDVELDLIIRSAIIGGRVDGKPEITRRPLVMVDVVSLYPTIMEKEKFPTGREITYLSNQQPTVVELFKGGHLGLIHVKYDQRTLNTKTKHLILPNRTVKEGAVSSTLDWTDPSPKTAWLPTVTILQLDKYGVTMEIVPDEQHRIAIMWSNSAKIFESYIKELKEAKNSQDKYKREGDVRYNPSLRQMIKLLLNAVSGKMVQRNFDTKSEYVTSEKQLGRLLKKVGHSSRWHESGILVSPISANSGFVEYKLSPEESYKNPKPSIVGIFIYAYARAYMYEHTYSKFKVYYSDTDSVVIPLEDYEKIDPALRIATITKIDGKTEGKTDDTLTGTLTGTLTKTRHKVNNEYYEIKTTREKTFGDFELEAGSNGELLFDKLVVISPKVYALYLDDNIVKSRFKGVRTTDEFLYLDGNWYPITEPTGRNLKGFFDLLSRRLDPNCPEELKKIKIRTTQIRKKLREGRLHHAYMEKLI